MTKWGVYDTQEKCWLGDEKGPKLFDEELMARISAQMADVQFGYAPGRTKAKEYDGTGNKFKDEVQTKLTPLEALRKAEEEF